MSAPPPMAVALAAEQAAIYAYGIIGVRLTSPGDLAGARAAEQAHRSRRDLLVAEMAEHDVAAEAAPAGYEMPYPIVDRASALKLAIRVEDGVAQAWRPVLAVTTAADRVGALAALTDAAVRATRWRRLAGVAPVTLPFPGAPPA